VRASQHSETDLYRIVLFASHAAELLVLPENGRLRLPTLPLPKHQRGAQNLTASMRREWSQEATCLFCLDIPPTPSERRYQVMESCEKNPPHAVGSRWVPVSSLEESQFEEAADYAAVAKSFAECKEHAAGNAHGPFAHLGWFAELTAWVRDEIRPEGLTLNGRFSQLNSSPTFSLVRFETDGPAVWFKGVGKPNLREYPITLALSKYFPAFVPRIIAARADWNGWLAMEAKGAHPEQNSGIDVWTKVAARLADLQIASLGQTLHLIDAGCHDARVCSLVELINPFLEVMAELMEQQVAEPPARLSRLQLAELAAQLEALLADFHSFELPTTLGHLDFSPSNIVTHGASCIFLDWAEACCGPCSLTVQYLVEHVRRLNPRSPSCESPITSAYLRPWSHVIDPRTIVTALNASQALAVFVYAVCATGWRDVVRRQNPREAGYLRSLTRRLKRECDALEPCAFGSLR
jgi:hypothetical protein